jgi:hypothetical protein
LTARSIPTLPTWTAGMRVLGSYLAAMVAYQQFWADPPMFSMYQSVVQSVPNAADTKITMDASEHDTDTGRGVSTPWTYTIPIGMTGRWRFTASVKFGGNATGIRQTKIFKNGTVVNAAEAAGMAGPATDFTGYVISREFSCTAGDVISVYAYQNSGGPLNTNVGGSLNSFFEGQLVSLANP